MAYEPSFDSEKWLDASERWLHAAVPQRLLKSGTDPDEADSRTTTRGEMLWLGPRLGERLAQNRRAAWRSWLRLWASFVAVAVLTAGCSLIAGDADGAVPAEGMELAVGESAVVVFPPDSATGAVPTVGIAREEEAPRVVPHSGDGDLALVDEGSGERDGADGVRVVPLGDGVSVQLDDGHTQPSSPVEVRFSLPAELLVPSGSGQLGAPTGMGDLSSPAAVAEAVRRGNVALLVLSGDGSMDVLPAHLDESAGVVRGEVPHFTNVWPISVDFQWLVDTVLQSLSLTSKRPGCEGKTARVRDVTYSTISQAQMWMCVEAAGDELVVSATPNAPTPFVATPSIEASRIGPGAELSVASLLAVTLARASNWPTGSVPVFPGGTTRFYFDQTPASFEVQLDSAPQLYMLQILSELASVLLGISGYELVEKIAALECFADVLSLSSEVRIDTLTPPAVSGLWQSFFSCAGTAVSELGGALSPAGAVLLAIVSVGPSLLIGGLLGAVTEADLGSVAAPIDAAFDEDDLAASAWEQFVGTWSGMVSQTGFEYGVEVTLFVNPAGRLRGKVVYPELDGCAGTWSSPRLSGRTLRMVERIADGDHPCILEVRIGVTISDDGNQMEYSVDGYNATATLLRGAYQGLDRGTGRGTSTWPVGKNEAPPSLLVWFGANGYNSPKWVACDDRRDWCVADQGSGVAVVFDLRSGISEHGSVRSTTADPSLELRGLGVPTKAIAELLT